MANATYRGRIIVNDTDYTGSFVDPNPSGVATDDLNTVSIDGKIFNVVGSRGGGTSIILNGQIYSTEEKVVGIWTDGKPLYQKTFERNLTLPSATWVVTGDSIPNGQVVKTEATKIDSISDSVLTWGEIGSDGHIELINIRPVGSVTISHYTMWYTKTTDVAGSGGFQAYGFTPIIYSTEEREVGVWTDNKPLYQKTFIITSKQSQIDISSLNIDTYVKSESVYRIGSYCFEMPRLSDSTQNYNAYISTYYAELNSGNINFLWGTNVSSVDELHFTIQYTKTTDVAGSGEYNTLGVPNVHYSTDEQVIGTWIDGRTLYRRVYDFTSSPITIPTNTWLKVANDWQIQPIRGTAIITSTRAAYDVAVDCDDNDGLYVRSWLNYSNVNYLIVEYVKDSN